MSETWIPEFISVGFIAKVCGVSNTTVLRWISTGQLPAFRLPGGHFRIERQDLSEFLSRHSIPTHGNSRAQDTGRLPIDTLKQVKREVIKDELKQNIRLSPIQPPRHH